ncbi:MAG: S53 family peptidase [Acidobacteriota bacterium]
MAEVLLLLRRRPGAEPPDVISGSWDGVHLTHAQLGKRHGATADDLAAVRAFARKAKLEIESVDAGSRRVLVAGGRRALERAFKVKLRYHAEHGRTFRTHDRAPRIPRELNGIVTSVFGLDDRPLGTRHRRAGAGHDPRKALWPSAVAALYHFPRKLDGRGHTIAILELGGGLRKKDVKKALRKQGIAMPRIDVVTVAGARDRRGRDRAADDEMALDVQVAAAAAPGARLVVYIAPDTERGLVEMISTAIHDRAHAPTILSLSWGQPESDWSSQGRAAIEAVLHDAALLGITVVASAGDAGSAGSPGAKGVAVNYPASSAYVLGCGGTSLRLSRKGRRIRKETVWNDLPSRGATGGGVSQVFSRPLYQKSALVPPAARPGGRDGRGVPDVAASADPDVGYLVRLGGKTVVNGGTSASTPLWAALIARLNQGIRRNLGFLNPVLYGELGPSGTLREITKGSNGAYRASPGWNPCTGLGSPRGKRMLEALRRTSASRAAGARPRGRRRRA